MSGMPAHLRFASRAGIEGDNASSLEGMVRAITFRDGDTLFAPSKACEGFIVIDAGRVRVLVTGENGRQITLYHITPGESCIVTTACLMAEANYEAEALAESKGQALVLNGNGFRQLLDASPKFRKFVFQGFASRFAGVLSVMQAVVERKLGHRLARMLAEAAPELAMTQQKIAQELGTAREVVGRLLKEFELRNWIKVKRGRIEILRRTRLLEFGVEV